MSERIPFSQLWREEEDYLQERARHIPAGGSVVEIGTGQGGSAFLFGVEAAPRGVRVVTYDAAPVAETFENLRGLDVTIRAMDSITGAATFDGGPIDFLFIDAGHAFHEVEADFRLWSRHLRPGAAVLFHDFDPLERGGTPHLGVRLFGDALLSSGSLDQVTRVGRILAGTVPDPATAVPPPAAYDAVWRAWGDRLLRTLNSRGCDLYGDPADPRVRFLAAFLDARIVGAIDPARATLVYERPFSKETLDHAAAGRPVELADDGLVAYLVREALAADLDLLLASVSSRDILFKNAELDAMLDLGAGLTYGLDTVFAPLPTDPLGISARCAHELVRLSFMETIVRALC